jgi:hypothetical protein
MVVGNLARLSRAGRGDDADTAAAETVDRRPLRAGLDAQDRGLAEGIPVTAVPRTLLDLAVRLPRHRLDRCIERAEELYLLDLREVEALLRRTRGHPGRGRLRRALALYETPRFTRSELERRVIGGLRGAGLSAPATGFNVLGHELDLYWPDLQLAVEIDTYETHGTRAAFERDRVRDSELRAAGIEVERVTGLRIERELDGVVRQIAARLASRRRALSLPPNP